MDEAVRIAAVVLHYGDPALAAGVAAVLRQADGPEDVFIFDNHAPTLCEGAWRRAKANLYWAGALADCLHAARGMGYTHLWFLNNDITFVSNGPFLKRAAVRVARMEQRLGHAVGVWTPSVVRSPYHPQMISRAGVQYTRIALADGIAPLYSLDCVEAVGGVDAVDNPYGYGVDLWLSLRAHRAGWPVVVDHQVTVSHRYHTTARRLDGFLALAGQAEDAYMTSRLGAEWRETVRELQQTMIHESEL